MGRLYFTVELMLIYSDFPMVFTILTNHAESIVNGPSDFQKRFCVSVNGTLTSQVGRSNNSLLLEIKIETK